MLSTLPPRSTRSVKGWTWSSGLAYARTFDSFGRLASYPLGNPTGSGTAAGLLRTLAYCVFQPIADGISG